MCHFVIAPFPKWKRHPHPGTDGSNPSPSSEESSAKPHAKRSYDLILVARNEERLNAVASRLRGETGRLVKVLPADLNDKASLAKVEAVL